MNYATLHRSLFHELKTLYFQYFHNNIQLADDMKAYYNNDNLSIYCPSPKTHTAIITILDWLCHLAIYKHILIYQVHLLTILTAVKFLSCVVKYRFW